MPEKRIPDPTLMARLQLSVKGVDWAASLVRHRQHEQMEGQWSPHQHLFHLISVERHVYQPRIARIVSEEIPVLVNFDTEGYMRERYDNREDIDSLAEQFMAEREKSVGLFKGLTAEQWLRKGAWPDGRHIDLAWLAEKCLWHSLDHFTALLDLHSRMEPIQARGWATG